MEIVSRHSIAGSQQSWHDKAWAGGDNTLGTHTKRPGCALDKALCARPGLSRKEVGARQGFSVVTKSSL